MKATCIIGSPRANGSCAHLIGAFARGLTESGCEVQIYCVGQSDIRYCVGCKRCYETGRCFQTDDVPRILEDVLCSDIVCIAAPSYWADVPGQLKVLFDRSTPYGDTNPNRALRAERPIKGVAIAVRAGVRESENELLLSAISHYFGHLGIETEERISIRETDTLEDLMARHAGDIERVYRLGRRLAAR